MLKIYHNPRCRKSREGLAILEESGKEYDVVKYLENPPSYIELAAIIGKLKIQLFCNCLQLCWQGSANVLVMFWH